MSDELLAKEKEFHRLNNQLEEKARQILEDVNSFTKQQINNISKKESRKALTSDTNDITRKQNANITDNKELQPGSIEQNSGILCSFEESTSHFLQQKLETMSIKDHDISTSKGNSLGYKATIDFLKAKLDMLHNELRTIQLEYKNKVSYCEELDAENKKLSTSKTKLNNYVGLLKEGLAKLENTNADLQLQNNTLHTENVGLKKDIDGLKKEIRILNQQLNNYDLRLNRSLEDNEKLKNTVKFHHMEEKGLRNEIRNLQEDKRQTTKHLEKQRAELVQAFKKQLLLIDNLKKQNAFFRASKEVQLKEEDLLKLLT